MARLEDRDVYYSSGIKIAIPLNGWPVHPIGLLQKLTNRNYLRQLSDRKEGTLHAIDPLAPVDFGLAVAAAMSFAIIRYRLATLT